MIPKTDQIITKYKVQNKQNKKDTFFSNPKFWLFGDFLKLKFFLRRILHKNLQIHWGSAEIGKKIQSAFIDLSFLTRNSQNFENKNYKIIVVDKTLIPKYHIKNSDDSIMK